MRFPGFSGAWVEKKLSEIASFSKGKGISKSDIANDGLLECIRYGQLYTDYSEVIDEIVSKTNIDKNNLVLSESGDVIIPASGETQIDIATASCVLKSGVALGGDLNIIKTSINGVFLSYYLNNTKKFDIARLSQGISVVHLYASQLKTLKLNVPPQEEQQKISKFLTVIEARISTQIEIIEDYKQLKKGMMQKIFQQELRFKNEEGKFYPKWEEKRLGEVCKLQGGYAFISSKFKKSGIPIIRISNISNNNNVIETKGLVYYESIQNDSKFILKKGDLIIAMSGATTGKSSIYNLDVKGYLNQRVGLFKPTNYLNNNFLIQFVFSTIFKNQLTSVLVAGAQPNISGKDIENFKIEIPTLSEQQKIASTLSAIDSKITLESAYLDKLKAQKKYLLQNMFV